MAASLPSPLELLNDKRLITLIDDGGKETLRNVFLNIYPEDLQNVLKKHHSTLHKLFKRRKISKEYWCQLYPKAPKKPNIQNFDINLLFILLRNICDLSPPAKTGWNNMPRSGDDSPQANIVRIKLFRYDFFGQFPGTGISLRDFEARWAEVSSALLCLGYSQREIDSLKDKEIEIPLMREKTKRSQEKNSNREDNNECLHDLESEGNY